MDRRSFLKTLGLVIPATIVAPTYFFAPKGGWLDLNGLAWATNGCPGTWVSKTPEEILKDFNFILRELEKPELSDTNIYVPLKNYHFIRKIGEVDSHLRDRIKKNLEKEWWEL